MTHFGPLPGEVLGQIRPRPPDFTVPIVEDAKRYSWRGKVTIEEPGRVERIDVEVGYRKSQGKTADDVLELVWHVTELARLGWREGLAPASTGRHAGVKPTAVDPKAWLEAQARAGDIRGDLERQAAIDAETLAEAQRLTKAG